MRSNIMALSILVMMLSLTMSTVGFSVLQLDERNVDVAVAAEDSEGILALEAGDSELSQMNDDGELEITLEGTDSDGVNPSSNFRIGEEDPIDGAAFTATNSYQGDVELTLLAEGNELEGDADILLEGGGAESIVEGQEVTIDTVILSQGESSAYSILFDTGGVGEETDGYDIDLSFEVEPADTGA